MVSIRNKEKRYSVDLAPGSSWARIMVLSSRNGKEDDVELLSERRRRRLALQMLYIIVSKVGTTN